jgi:integrase
MNEMVIVGGPQPIPSSIVVHSEATRLFILEAEAPSTKKAYATDFRTFTGWCDRHGRINLPADPATVADFLSDRALNGIKPSTLGRHTAAIRYAHRLVSLPSPTDSEQVKKALKGIRRTMGARKTQKAAATADLVRAMMDVCGDTMLGKRDRALIAFGFSGAFRRSELVALRVEDLSHAEDGVRVLIRASKTDKEKLGQVIAIPRGRRLRPLHVLEEWLEAAGIKEGPIFRRVRSGGVVGSEPLSDHSVAKVVKARALKAGLDPALFSGHSLRAGFITSAARGRASLFKMQAVSRHKNMEMLNTYVRDTEAFDDHAGETFL